jgi:hypothetical protein
MEKGPEEIVEKQNKAPGEETEIKAKTMASSKQQPNWTVQFGKPDHSVSRIRTEEDIEDYCTQDSTSTPLVSSRTHT